MIEYPLRIYDGYAGGTFTITDARGVLVTTGSVSESYSDMRAVREMIDAANKGYYLQEIVNQAVKGLK